jgi:magnesium transporter
MATAEIEPTMIETLAEGVESAIATQSDAQITQLFRNSQPAMIGAVLERFGDRERLRLLGALPADRAAIGFTFLPIFIQAGLLAQMPQPLIAAILNQMPDDDRTRLLAQLPPPTSTRMLALLNAEERKSAIALLGYPADSVGSLMTPHYIAVSKDWSIQRVLDYVRANGQDSDTLSMIYVVDDTHHLIDDIPIRQFLLAPVDAHVSDIMDYKFVALQTSQVQGEALKIFRREDRKALPIVDAQNVLVGIVTIDDILRVSEAEATREVQRIGGSEALDEPYMTIGFGRMISKRAGWLVFLFLGEMLTATAMGFFEKEIEKAVVLALFVPLIISSGGNSGSQASTLVIRALAVGEVALAGWWRVMRRELLTGLALGSILGAIGFCRIAVWSEFSAVYGPHWLLVAITVGLSLIGIVMWGTLAGSMLPFLMRRLGFDPATSSAPFVATLVDVTGLVIYFSVGLLVLRGTLL